MKINKEQNIFFWYGNDDFSMQELLRGEKSLMLEKNPNADINDFDFSFTDSRFELETKVREALRANSLFSSDKLTVVRNFWSGKKKAKKDVEEDEVRPERKNDLEDIIIDYVSKINPGDKIFFLESKTLDKRSRAYKFFEGLAKGSRFDKREFVLPTGFQFNVWLENRTKKCGGKISKANVDLLAVLLGKGREQKERSGILIVAYDLFQSALEIDKLIAYCDGREIEKDDILLLVSGTEDMNIFNLIESLGRKDKNRALSILSGQIRQGFNGNYIMTMLVFHFRNLISIKSLLREGLNAGEISKRTNIHPYVVEKNIGYARSFKEEDLVLVYKKLYSADLSIKTGKMEPELALDLLVAAI